MVEGFLDRVVHSRAASYYSMAVLAALGLYFVYLGVDGYDGTMSNGTHGAGWSLNPDGTYRYSHFTQGESVEASRNALFLGVIAAAGGFLGLWSLYKKFRREDEENSWPHGIRPGSDLDRQAIRSGIYD